MSRNYADCNLTTNEANNDINHREGDRIMAQENRNATTERPPTGFERITQIIKIPVEFETIGTLSIMSGIGDGVLDNTVQRTGNGDYDFAITGSSLKGVTRSTIEAMLANVEKVCAPMACAPQRQTIPGRLEDCGEVIRKTTRERKSIPSGLPCAVCQMFGSTWQKGKVVFRDAQIVDAEGATPIPRTHVAIDREKGTASPRALTTIETLPKGLTFSGSVGLTNAADWMIGAVIYVLDEIIEEVGLGAKTNAGYGQLCVKVGDPKFVFPPQQTPETFRKHCLDEWFKKLKIDPPSNN